MEPYFDRLRLRLQIDFDARSDPLIRVAGALVAVGGSAFERVRV